jgi:tRNA(Ile)-lysidine synthase TilS/MesJ
MRSAPFSIHIDSYYKRVAKICSKYGMLAANDRILIGLSGGKDSLFLVESLAYIKKHLPFPVEIIVAHIHIKEVGYLADESFQSKFCNTLGLNYIWEELTVDITANPKKSPCFVCSWHRRKRLFELTRKYNCNKLALGHHMDDAIETLLINMAHHGSISSLPAKLKMFNGRVYLIRPLIEFTSQEMFHIAELRKYPQLKSECPYHDKTRRTAVRVIIDTLEKLNPLARKNIFRAMGNTFPEYLPNGFPEKD